MKQILLYTPQITPALAYATRELQRAGFQHTTEVTRDVTHVLLPVPFVQNPSLAETLKSLPEDICLIGGNFSQAFQHTNRCLDLLQDPTYVAENANITAHCAILLAMSRSDSILQRANILVIGTGRIGKCLCNLLKGLGANVTVAARRAEHRAIARALGYQTEDTASLSTDKYDIIFNTVPVMLCPSPAKHALKIDLASERGLGGSDVIWARGLPGKLAPASSGKLIARQVYHHISKEGSV